MAVETQDGKILHFVITRIVVDVMNLNCLAALTTNATGSIGEKENRRCEILGNLDSFFHALTCGSPRVMHRQKAT